MRFGGDGGIRQEGLGSRVPSQDGELGLGLWGSLQAMICRVKLFSCKKPTLLLLGGGCGMLSSWPLGYSGQADGI